MDSPTLPTLYAIEQFVDHPDWARLGVSIRLMEPATMHALLADLRAAREALRKIVEKRTETQKEEAQNDWEEGYDSGLGDAYGYATAALAVQKVPD